MGNCSCCVERARVTAWDDDDDWGLPPAERSGRAARGVAAAAENSEGTRIKIRMTKGQLRRLLENSGGRRGVEDVVAEIMSMGSVHVDVVAELLHDVAETERHHRHRRPPKLEAIQEQEDDLVE